MKITQIKGNTYCIQTAYAQIPYYKVSANQIILLDTGVYGKQGAALHALFKANNLNVVGILLSHAHLDHMGNIKFLRDYYGCETAASAPEAFLAQSPQHMKIANTDIAMSQLMGSHGNQFIQIDTVLKPSDTKVTIAGVPFDVLYTPGHSPGHISITTPDCVSYVGDAMISKNAIGTIVKLPYAFLVRDAVLSMGKILSLNCDSYILAHNGITKADDIGQCYRLNVALYHKVLTTLYGALKQPTSLDDLVADVYNLFGFSISTQSHYSYTRESFASFIQYMEDTGAVTAVAKDNRLMYMQADGELLFADFERISAQKFCRLP